MCDRVMVGGSTGCHLPISVLDDADSDDDDDESSSAAATSPLTSKDGDGTWMIATTNEICRWDRKHRSLVPVVPLGRPTYFLEPLKCALNNDEDVYIMALSEGGDKVAFHDVRGNMVGRLAPTVPPGMGPQNFQITAFAWGPGSTVPSPAPSASTTTTTTRARCWLGCSDGTVRSYECDFACSGYANSAAARASSRFVYRAHLPGSLGHGVSAGVSGRVKEGVVGVGGIKPTAGGGVVVGDSRGKVHFLSKDGEPDGNVAAGEQGGVRGILKAETGRKGEEAFVVMSGRCTTVKVKEDGSKNVVRRNNDVAGGPRGGAVLKDGRVVVVGGDGSIKVEHSPSSNRGGGRRRGGMEKGRVAFISVGSSSPCDPGRYVATAVGGENGGQVKVTKVDGEEHAGTIEFEGGEEVTGITAGEGWLAAATTGGGKFVDVTFEDGKISKVQAMEAPEELEGVGVSCLCGRGGYWGMGLDDGDVVVGRCEDGQVEVTKVIEQEEGLPRGSSGIVQEIDISMDGRWVAGSRGNKNGGVRVWDLEGGEGG
ncbi:hypothetical protein TrRE_jg8552, partial [Triparma retinervis]